MSAAIAEEPSGPPLAVDSLPVRRRAKLESLDKLIGQQPDVVHHVRLHAAPSQRAYLPAWLAAPLGRRQPADAEGQPAPALGALPPIAEHGSGVSSRSISGDLSYLRSSAAAAPAPPSRVRRTQSTDSGLLRLVHAMRAAPEQRQGGGPAATLHAGDSLWELGDSLPLPHPDRPDALAGAARDPRPPSPPLGQTNTPAPATSPAIALIDAVAAGRALEACAAPPQLGALLAGGPAQLGISPFLLAWWLGSEDHLAAFLSAEAVLRKHYSRFILDAQAFPEPPSVQKQYEDLCRMPALVEGI